MRMNLTAIAVRRPVAVVMALGLFVVFGVVAFTKLPVRQLPNVNFPFVRVTIADPGTNAATIAQSVTTPVEKALSSESGVVSMVGTSAPGRSVVALQFQGGTNIDQAAASVALALEKLTRALPTTASPPSIIKANPNALPMMDVAVSGRLASSQLFALATNLVAPTLQEIPGVAQVTVVGGQQQVVTVDLSPSALAAYGVSVPEVAAALRSENTAVTGGLVVVGQHELLTRVHGGYSSVAQLASVPVAVRPGSDVLLGDVASLSQGLTHAQSYATLNGTPAVGLVLSASSTANSLQVDSAIRSALAKLGPQLPPGVSTTITGDVTSYVRGALANVELDLFLGIFIAALVLAVFLHRLANTVIVMLAIPVSIIATFSVMYFLGFSLDLISLMALSLLIGILVDDSIVVLENIHRHRRMGKPAAEAAVDGRMEIGAAAVAITLTDVVVYAPVAFVSGNVGQLFHEFAVTIVAATLFSLLVSYTLTPMLAARWGGDPSRPGRGVGARLGQGFDAGFEQLRGGYRHVITWALRHRAAVTAVAVAAGVASALIVQSGVLPTTFVPPEDNGVLTVNATLPAGTPLTAARATLVGFAGRLQQLAGVRDVFVSAGYQGGGGTGHNLGQITLDLGPTGTRPPIRSYVRQVARLARRYPGLTAHGHVQNPFIAGGARAASVDVLGPDQTELDTLATAIAARLAHSSAVSQVSTSVPSPIPELSIAVNHAEAAFLGVTTTTIGSTVAAALGGVAVPPLVTAPGAPVETVQVTLGGGPTLTPAQIASIPVPAGRGTVPLDTVASLSEAPGPAKIIQINREYAVTVSASSPTGNSGPAMAALLSAARSVGLPTGYSVQLAGEALTQQQDFGPLIGALALSVLLVYMLLAALYESLLDPLAVLLAVPLATVGALGALWVTHLPVSIFALLAMIMLMGLVAKNAILLIDFAKTLRRRGMARNPAIVESGATRIRPILMTTATMVGAMLPLALGTGSGASERMPIGTVLIGGLLSSTLLSLLVVPVLYSLIDDGAGWLGELLRRAPAAAPSPTAHR